MRVLAITIVLALSACASTGGGGADSSQLAPLPFPVERGSALPPPTPSASQTAPPEGAAPGGLDFGQWRAADPAIYSPAFQAQIRQRFGGQDEGQLRASLEGNGFLCDQSQRLDCRIEIMESQCAVDWYVVLERGRAEPVAGFDRMCLGARAG
jgi:hypothetical protein